MDARSWLRGRRPAAPSDLVEAMTDALEATVGAVQSTEGVAEATAGPIESTTGAFGSVSGAGVAGRLAGAALHDLRRAHARPGRVRESAFALLSADGLLTHACEVALESHDPEGALAGLVVRSAER